MARKSTKSTVETNAAITENVIAANDKTVEKKENEIVKETTTKATATVKTESVEPLMDSDEIEVVSLVPNVSYKDSKTNDIFEWEEDGHSEFMTFETLKNMWRNHKGYFKDMLLKPNDSRVIAKFGLKNVYEKYEFLMNESNYTRKNINALCEAITASPNGLKYTICNKVKSLVVSGGIADIVVIKSLEKQLNLDLTSFLD